MRSLVLSIAVIVTFLVGFAPRADAATKMGTAKGTWAITSADQSLVSKVGGDTTYYQTFTLVYSGDLKGTTYNWGYETQHKDGTWAIAEDYETCSNCTLAGRTGSFDSVWNYVGHTVQATVTMYFTCGRGGLTGLVAGGVAIQNALAKSGFPIGTYTYTYELPSSSTVHASQSCVATP
jgi:hypothetical protein